MFVQRNRTDGWQLTALNRKPCRIATERRRFLAVPGSAVLLLVLSVGSLDAAMIQEKGKAEPTFGFIVAARADELVIEEVDAMWKRTRRVIPRARIESIEYTVSPQRLEQLTPDRPNAYREYAEELSAKQRDPEAREMAIRLFQIAAWLDDRLRLSCLKAMIDLARTPTERRLFQAAAFLSDPRHDRNLLKSKETQSQIPLGVKVADQPSLERVMDGLRLLRQGDKQAAAAIFQRQDFPETLARVTDRITVAELRAAARWVCPLCDGGKVKCPQCKGTGCEACQNGRRDCVACLGTGRSSRVAEDLLGRILEVELARMPRPQGAQREPDDAASVASWSQLPVGSSDAPLRSFDPAGLTEFDPRQNVFRQGKWSANRDNLR